MIKKFKKIKPLIHNKMSNQLNAECHKKSKKIC